MQGYPNTNVKYISSGLVFDKEKVVPVRNRVFYDKILTPSKPAQGGFWGSLYTPEAAYRSDWERFIKEKMYLQEDWLEKIEKPSTIFSLRSDTWLLYLDTFRDLYGEMIEQEDGRAKLQNPVIVPHYVKVIQPEFSAYAKQPFINFEEQQKIFDAMAVSKNFVNLVSWCLNTFDRRAAMLQAQGIFLSDEALDKFIYNENLTKYDVVFAEMFEDWHVESILVFNPECVNVIDIV